MRRFQRRSVSFLIQTPDSASELIETEMGQVTRADRATKHTPSLDGLRGYGFLLVFCAHYFYPTELAHPQTLRLKFLTSLYSLAVFAVPTFFVLSGYLIGGILYDTRQRPGYFKVFYSRRVLRVFPVFYLTLLAILGFLLAKGIVPNFRFWSHFLYIQNLLPSTVGHQTLPVTTVHFWSLAVEEQFYLIWPVIVWWFPQKNRLLKVTLALIAGCFAFRLMAPMLASTPGAISGATPMHADAILLGVALALVRQDSLFERIKYCAKWIVLCGGVSVVCLANWKGTGWIATFRGLQIGLPIVHITAAALIVAVVEEGSLLSRICRVRWACWLGNLSYSLYVFHFVYAHFFLSVLPAKLCEYMRNSFAVLTSGLLAFALTLTLSVLSMLLVEGPIIRLKRHVRYRESGREVLESIGGRVLVGSGR